MPNQSNLLPKSSGKPNDAYFNARMVDPADAELAPFFGKDGIGSLDLLTRQEEEGFSIFLPKLGRYYSADATRLILLERNPHSGYELAVFGHIRISEGMFLYYLDETQISGFVALVGVARGTAQDALMMFERLMCVDGETIPEKVSLSTELTAFTDNILAIWKRVEFYRDWPDLYDDDISNCVISDF